MNITLLCNAGLMLEYNHEILLVDLPNQEVPPFGVLPENTWQRILSRTEPFNKVCGFWFSHIHPDHCDMEKVRCYMGKWPNVPIFLPEKKHIRGKVRIGSFSISYQRLEHAPIPDAPDHVVTLIEAGGRSLYLAADAALNCDSHRAFLKDKKVDAAVWNSMYLSREETRALICETAEKSYIYHMPPCRPDAYGLWKKLDHNLNRYPELRSRVTVWEQYPSEAII